MKSELINGIEIEKDFISNIIKNQNYNQEVILDYYSKLQYEFTEFIRDDLHFKDEDEDVYIKRYNVLKHINLDNKINSIKDCNSMWLLDVYRQQKVKDFKKTNLCKDKFCNNCKKVKQASRLAKFMPLVEEHNKYNNLYHMVLTVPNCNGTNLDDTIKTMFKSFTYLIEYLKLKKKIKNLDFEQYNYLGAIRSLEVTFKNDDYHPHLHCIFAFDKPLIDNKYIENTYSNSRKNGYRKFTDFEVLIQKIWYLLNTKQRVTKKAIDDTDIGYSCTIDPIDESSAYEVFKYMTKSTDEDSNILTYENFKTLYFALHRVRQIQGYGCFYNIKDDDSMIDEVDDFYNVLINILKSKENPEEVSQTPQDLLCDNEYKLISRKRVYSYLKKL